MPANTKLQVHLAERGDPGQVPKPIARPAVLTESPPPRSSEADWRFDRDFFFSLPWFGDCHGTGTQVWFGF
jgi:hypothetical protein